jgi:hypothetical protein
VKKIIIIFTVLLIILTACESPLNNKYSFSDPISAYEWICENFVFENVGYNSPTKTLEIRKGDCYTLSMLFCHLLQDAYSPEIVVGVIQGTWHAIAKIDGTYYDLGMRGYGKKSPFEGGFSISMPWRMAKGYRWYANFVE